MTVILHAGMPKTGTSTIQAVLAANREQLEAAGVIYPQFDGTDFNGHWQLSAYWESRGRGRLERRKKNEDSEWAQGVKSAVSQILQRAARTGECVLLSTEAMSAELAAPGCKLLLAEIEALGLPVKVVAYVRSPVEHCVSHVQQKLKNLRVSRMSPLGEWTSMHEKRADLLFSTFGQERVSLRLYQRGRDVVADFEQWLAKTCGRPLPALKRVPNANTSLSGPACALLALAKLNGHGAAENHTAVLLRKYLIEFAPAAAPPRLVLPADFLEMVAANNAESWNRLVDLSDAAPDEKEASKLQPRPVPAKEIGKRDVRQWLLSYYDKSYVAALRTYVSENARGNAEAINALIDELADQFVTGDRS